MSEQNDDPTLEEDTGTTTPEVEQGNWEDRYKEAQAWGTRMAQERSQYETAAQRLELLRNDPDAQREFLSELGYQVESDDEIPDPNADVRRELDEIKAWKSELTQSQKTEQRRQQDIEVIGAALGNAQKDLGREFTEQEIRILDRAARADRDEQGNPAIGSVLTDWLAAREHDQTTWAATKKRASRQSAAGQAGTSQPDLENMTDAERQHWMTQQLNTLNE